MKPTEPLPLYHSWPICERSQRFDLGWVSDMGDRSARAAGDLLRPIETRVNAPVGRWSCDLQDNRLTWSDAVYDLFGLPRGASVARADAVGRYAEGSRAAMERLRSYAIKHRRGFTLDAEIMPFNAGRRWMRLVCLPVCDANDVVRLEGLKQDVTDAYL